MQAYEFIAKTQGGVIRIPDELKDDISTLVKVIVEPAKVSDLILPPFLDTRGWKFCREEANAR
ncbi:MAG: hypothetical protein LBE35_02740 [Clostridiales bacterium]|jgi:hypothetical protein|nr:hypothetical protein [Clostridiales bacterium]